MKHLSIGIAGYGLRGRQLHLLFDRHEEGVYVTNIADPTFIAMDVNELTTYTPLLSVKELCDSRCEVVVIATPDYLHEEHACLALDAGKHVFLEKPMAITSEGCDRIMEAARRNNRVLYVGHNLRHFTVIKKLKQLIDSGAVGDVKSVWCRHPVSYGRWGYFKEGRWHKKRSHTESLLIHKGSHDLDVIHWLAGGYTTRVVAMGSLSVWGDQPGEPDIEDMSSVLMHLDNGVQATYSQCHFAFGLACREYMIFGTNGTLRNQGDNPATAVVQLFSKRGFNPEAMKGENYRFTEEQGFHGDADRRIIDEFIGILRGTAQPTISLNDAAWAVKTGYAATHSLRNGNIVVNVK